VKKGLVVLALVVPLVSGCVEMGIVGLSMAGNILAAGAIGSMIGSEETKGQKEAKQENTQRSAVEGKRSTRDSRDKVAQR
jgi:hypothetical protein